MHALMGVPEKRHLKCRAGELYLAISCQRYEFFELISDFLFAFSKGWMKYGKHGHV